MLMVSPTADDYIYIAVGLLLGYLISLNRKSEKENEVVEKLDKQMRKDLEYYKNLSESLQEDLTYTKIQLREIQKKNEL
jgi:hypothetical protein